MECVWGTFRQGVGEAIGCSPSQGVRSSSSVMPRCLALVSCTQNGLRERVRERVEGEGEEIGEGRW